MYFCPLSSIQRLMRTYGSAHVEAAATRLLRPDQTVVTWPGSQSRASRCRQEVGIILCVDSMRNTTPLRQQHAAERLMSAHAKQQRLTLNISEKQTNKQFVSVCVGLFSLSGCAGVGGAAGWSQGQFFISRGILTAQVLQISAHCDTSAYLLLFLLLSLLIT